MPIESLIELPVIPDHRGNLSFFENNNQIPFAIKSTYWIYDVPGGELKGGLCIFDLQEVIFALSGSFEVVIDDGYIKKKFTLNRPNYGLYVPPGVWRRLENFSTNSLALVVTDGFFNENGHEKNYEQFLKQVNV